MHKHAHTQTHKHTHTDTHTHTHTHTLTCTQAEVPVADDYTYLQINPHNPQQICYGHAKRLTVNKIGYFFLV
jgi:hypothetical protein